MRIGLAALACGFALFVAAPARAGGFECTTDADCPSGLSCHTRTVEECVGWSDETGAFHEECTTETVRACGPRDCDVDADCPAGLGCIELPHRCGWGFEEEGEECSAEPVRSCGIRTCETSADCTGPASCLRCEDFYGAEECAGDFGALSALCLPPFLAPCSLDADCGPGFRCEPELDCEPGTPRDEEADAGGDVDCDETFPGTCMPILVPCAEDVDCTEGLVCEKFRVERCDEEEGGGGPTAGGGLDEEGEECAEEEVATCLPPNAFAWFAGDIGDARAGEELGADQGGNGDDGGGGGSSSCSAAGAGVSLLGLLGAALLLRRR